MLTKRELAEFLNVSVRSVQRWVAQGCPCREDELGNTLLDPLEVVPWARGKGFLRSGEGAQESPAPRQTPTASREDLAKAEIARKISIVKRNELEINAERGLKDLGLADQVRQARTLEELTELGRDVTALVAAGSITASRATALRQLLADTRRNAIAASKHAKDEGEDGRVYLATERGLAVLRAFEAIVSDTRQERVATLVLAELEADLVEHPLAGPGAVPGKEFGESGPAAQEPSQ